MLNYGGPNKTKRDLTKILGFAYLGRPKAPPLGPVGFVIILGGYRWRGFCYFFLSPRDQPYFGWAPWGIFLRVLLR